MCGLPIPTWMKMNFECMLSIAWTIVVGILLNEVSIELSEIFEIVFNKRCIYNIFPGCIWSVSTYKNIQCHSLLQQQIEKFDGRQSFAKATLIYLFAHKRYIYILHGLCFMVNFMMDTSLHRGYSTQAQHMCLLLEKVYTLNIKFACCCISIYHTAQ